MRKFLSIGVVIVVGFSLMLYGYHQYVPLINQPKGIVFEIKAGMTKKGFIAQLAQAQFISHPILYTGFVYATPWQQLKKGEYHFPYQATFQTIWRQVTIGKGLNYHPFTIVPGMTFQQIKQALLLAPGLTIHLVNNSQLLQQTLKLKPNPEGMFFPETYFYTKGETDERILQQALQRMQQFLNQAWSTRDSHLPYATSYEALIAASLIEKEAKLASELPRIAGVLVNRLQKKMVLQFDPTVIYGLGEQYHGNLSKTDLQIPTAYNTYLNHGLPPTPIATPSKSAILATLHPERHDYYYFVAANNQSHIFSKTLAAHNEAVAQVIQTMHKPAICFLPMFK